MIGHVYKKELKDSFRDKKTIYLSVLLPILFNIGILFFFDMYISNQGKDEMNVVVNEQADNTVVQWMEQGENITIERVEDPVKAVEEGKALVAVEIDEQFMTRLQNMEAPNVTVYADQSSVKASATSESILGILSIQREQVLAQRLQELDIQTSTINPFEVKMEGLSGDDDGSLYIIAIFAQLVIVMGVMMGGMPAASDLFAGEKERNTMEALLMTPAKRLDLIVGKWLTIATLGMLSGVFSVVTFVLFVQYGTKTLVDALNISDNTLFFTGSLIVGIIVFSLLVACVFVVLSLIANTMKEAQNYISPMMTVAMIPYFLLIGTSVNELTVTHFLIPFFNIYALIKQLIYGVYDVTSMLYVAGSSIVVIAITFTLAYMMFTKSRWVLGKS
ncbi:ABC transporter permease [Metabacillus iocasae]|uniref:Sodium transport system permease protein n=1 Tax=Priestia iocasae TaxID=2291674 RepID=A0ABS2QSF3_9BACI|nr:ABC transporter permease [Metabacillus iocasae]MBM7702233.1 sodium transport system permease protein [Metabacillus iocasae]